MNWTFHLSCDRIQTNDCIFNPIQRAPPLGVEYRIQLKRVTSPFRSPDVGPSFDILSITTPEVTLPISTPINCGAKEVVAQVSSYALKNLDPFWSILIQFNPFQFQFICYYPNYIFQTYLRTALLKENIYHIILRWLIRRDVFPYPVLPHIFEGICVFGFPHLSW